MRVDKVHNVIIWGNHSSTQYPDVSHGQLEGGQKISDAVKDDAWLHGDFITVEWREKKILMRNNYIVLYLLRQYKKEALL